MHMIKLKTYIITNHCNHGFMFVMCDVIFKLFFIEFMNYKLDGNTFENNLITMLNIHMVDQNILFKISELLIKI
jgi:hypothetical protein